MNRLLLLTPDEWESRNAGRLRLVRAGDWPKACPLADPTDCNGEHCDCPLSPPAEFVQACAPCETCRGTRVVLVERDNGGIPAPCPDCRIELVGPCPKCEGVGSCRLCGRSAGWPAARFTLGYGYAVGPPVATDGRWSLDVAVES